MMTSTAEKYEPETYVEPTYYTKVTCIDGYYHCRLFRDNKLVSELRCNLKEEEPEVPESLRKDMEFMITYYNFTENDLLRKLYAEVEELWQIQKSFIKNGFSNFMGDM